MTNQQGAPEALDQLFEKLEDCIYEWSNYVRADDAPTTLPKYTAGAIKDLRTAVKALHAALVEAQQPACDTARFCQSVQRCTAKDETRARQPAPSVAVALSDDLRDRLVAISEAIADQDDRAAQAMLREILAAPQPLPAGPGPADGESNE